jgi:hypothetical protein
MWLSSAPRSPSVRLNPETTGAPLNQWRAMASPPSKKLAVARTERIYEMIAEIQEIPDCKPDFKNAPDSPELAAHAVAIWQLGKQTLANVIEIGRRLTECKRIVGHGNWLPWLDREFGWTDKTAENFINVYKLSGKFENFSNLDLPLSGLYLLAAPSTPEAARAEIIERAEKGEKIQVADVNNKIRAARPSRILDNIRKLKLGEESFKKIKGTSLDRADEKVALIYLNGGAPPGGLTPTVEKLIEDASAGKDVSAIQKSVEISVHKPTKKAMGRIAAREAQALALQDVGPNSTGELARMQARVDELENAKRRLELQNIGLRSEIKDAAAPADLTPLQLRAQLEKLSLLRFRQEVLPPDWIKPLTDYVISLATPEQLFATLECKIADKATRKYLHLAHKKICAEAMQ